MKTAKVISPAPENASSARSPAHPPTKTTRHLRTTGPSEDSDELLASDGYQGTELAHGYKTAPIGLAFMDTEQRFVHINDWLAALNGLSVEEHLGRRLSEVLPDVARGAEEQLRSVIETGEPILNGRVHAETPAHPGSKRHYEHNYYQEKSDDGVVVGVRCVVQDVTERQLAEDRIRQLTEKLDEQVGERTERLEEARRELEQRLQFEELISELSMTFSRLDTSDLDEHLDSAVEKICRCLRIERVSIFESKVDGDGYSIAHTFSVDGIGPALRLEDRDFPGISEKVLHGEPVVICRASDIPAGTTRKKAVEYEKAIASDDTLAPEARSAVVVPLMAGSEVVLGALCIAMISQRREWPEETVDRLTVIAEIFAAALDRRRSARELESSESRFHAIVEHSPDAMIITDSRGRIEQLNRQAASIFGYTESALRGKPVTVLLPPELAEVHGRHLAEFSKNPKSRDMGADRDLRARRKDGTLFPVEISLRPIGTGPNVSVAASIRDVSRQRAREEQLRSALDEAADLRSRLQAENLYLREEIQEEFDFEGIVGTSELLREVLRRVDQVAATRSSVLILGETGTGKELVVRALHSRSQRSDRPLVKVNCAAIPSSLMESEFFGHERGAFTGALGKKVGRFELAHGGTIFLDEIGDLSMDLQAKLLRVLQDGQFERLGSNETQSVDVRILAATNRDLTAEMEKGEFRPDLFYRLNVFPIEVPPLRERREDIPLLVWAFITAKQSSFNKTIRTVPVNTMKALQRYSWPGNIRELENVVERALIVSPGATLVVEESLRVPDSKARSGSRQTLDAVERSHILRVLESCDWKIKGGGHAAERLGLNESTLRSRMKKLGIQRPSLFFSQADR